MYAADFGKNDLFSNMCRKCDIETNCEFIGGETTSALGRDPVPPKLTLHLSVGTEKGTKPNSVSPLKGLWFYLLHYPGLTRLGYSIPPPGGWINFNSVLSFAKNDLFSKTVSEV